MKSLFLKEDRPQIMWLFDRWLDQLSDDLVLEAAKQQLAAIASWCHVVIVLWMISAVSFFCDFRVGAWFWGLISVPVLLWGLIKFKWEFLLARFRFRRDYRRLCRFFDQRKQKDLSKINPPREIPVVAHVQFVAATQDYLSSWRGNPFLSYPQIYRTRRRLFRDYQLLQRFGVFDSTQTLKQFVSELSVPDGSLTLVKDQLVGRG